MDRMRISVPAIAFAAGLCWIGWTAGHELTYAVLGLTHSLPAAAAHSYMPLARGAGALVAVIGFGFVLRLLFSRGSSADWLRSGGRLGTRGQLASAALAPTLTFVIAENIERLFADAQYASVLELVATGVPVQALVGMLTLFVARFALRAAAHVVSLLRKKSHEQTRPVELVPRRHSSPAVRRPNPLSNNFAGRAPPIAFGV